MHNKLPVLVALKSRCLCHYTRLMDALMDAAAAHFTVPLLQTIVGGGRSICDEVEDEVQQKEEQDCDSWKKGRWNELENW